LFPDIDVSYRGYVIWRGVLEEQYLSDSAPLENALSRLSYKGLPGHLLLYMVPGQDGSTTPGERWVNWAAYIPLTEADLPAFMVDKNGKQQAGLMPPGLMRPEEELRLKRLMSDHLPTYYSCLITASENTFAQPIYTVTMPAYTRDRMCLIGDAGSVAPPFTGSGVFKAVTNAFDLATALSTHETIEGALSEWSAAQTARARRLVVLGDHMEQALIWSAADFSQMDAETAANWWHAAVKLPEELDFGKTD
jgi:2-polyprenyl-6-methoxyphenol hydroxylase-like FAD-dependent oxidoreductase